MSQRLPHKIALITGGNSGIGRVTARRFVEEGARVTITGRNQATLDETVAELGAQRVTAFKADAASPAAMRRVLEAVKTKHGRLDVLFLNAGVAPLRACLKNGSSRREPALTASQTEGFSMRSEPTHVGCYSKMKFSDTL